jgi:dCTP deaminase
VYLSNRDIKWAIEQGTLIFRSKPKDRKIVFGETSVDLHLDSIDQGARVWNIEAFQKNAQTSGIKGPELHLGRFDYRAFSSLYLMPVPNEDKTAQDQKVFRRGDHVIVKPHGFVLWTTNEWVGTPKTNPQFICFVNAKSARARTGIVVHLTAPTIHAGWDGNLTLEIVNFGPFNFVLEEGDAIAQLTVAKITSSVDFDLIEQKSTTIHQTDPTGSPKEKSAPRKKSSKAGS